MDETRETHHHDNQFWIGLFLGGLLGALLILFLGTEKGKKLAKKLQEEGLDFLDDAKESFDEKKEAIGHQVVMQVEELKEKGADLLEEGRELLDEGKTLEEELAKKVIDKKNEVTQEVVAEADAALAHIEKLQERGRQTTQDLRRRLFKNIPKK